MNLLDNFFLCFIYTWLGKLLKFKYFETLDTHSSVPAMSSAGKML